MADEYSTYNLGDFKLKSGGTIPNAHIAYKTFGDSSLPAIVYPTWYSGCMLPTTNPLDIVVSVVEFASLEAVPTLCEQDKLADCACICCPVKSGADAHRSHIR